MIYFEETFLEGEGPNESQKDDLTWLNDHPDFLRRIRPLRDKELAIEATLAIPIAGVAVAETTNGLQKFYFEKGHPYARKLATSS